MDTALPAPSTAIATVTPTQVATASSMVPATSAAELPGFAGRLTLLPLKQKLLLATGLALLVGAVLATTLWANQGDYRPLHPGMSDKDAGEVVAQLSSWNTPYRFDGAGNVLVPAGQYHELKKKLAQANLPKGGSSASDGFDLMDKTSIGQTQFSERVNYQRSLQGALATQFAKMVGVVDAKVFLQMPQQTGFFREQVKPSASVVLTLRNGYVLDRSQIAGITSTVANSVATMNPRDVSVLDQTGALLSESSTDLTSGLDGQQLRYKRQIEADYNKRIFDLLEPVVGRDNLRSTVSADMDFSQVESTAEEYRPNQGTNANATVRSSQTSEQNNANPAQPTGVPGAASNQPPVPATAPVNAASSPLQTANGGSGNANSRREQVTNYEVDKTVRVTRNAVGTVKRLTAAIVVNHRTTTDAKGKSTTAALPQAELDRLTDLVKEAIGSNTDRGDSVKLVTAPFIVDKSEPVEEPLWKQPWLIDFARSAIVPLAFVAIALIATFGMVRPAIRAAAPPAPPEPEEAQPQKLDEMVSDEVVLLGGGDGIPRLEAPIHSEKLLRARGLARENPVAVANIVRDWMTGETS
ncbi:flagellar basal-body MS-ring/collar protein FliF [Roseateles paludis]|jgi:flagellar M-ring protein FliF|uniref:Flagellar M-ring protein n=1 Tax=Roseateles paludis TaxID=3145238 RepID=A0ABV0G0P1_9BURK